MSELLWCRHVGFYLQNVFVYKYRYVLKKISKLYLCTFRKRYRFYGFCTGYCLFLGHFYLWKKFRLQAKISLFLIIDDFKHACDFKMADKRLIFLEQNNFFKWIATKKNKSTQVSEIEQFVAHSQPTIKNCLLKSQCCDGC